MRKKLFVLMLLLFSIQYAHTQNSIKLDKIKRDKNNNISFVTLASESKLIANNQNFNKVLKQIFKPGKLFTFKQDGYYSDKLGYTHYRIKTYYENIEVQGMDFNVHVKDNLVRYLNGSFKNISGLPVKPGITEKIVMEKVEQAFNKVSKFSSITNEKIIQLIYYKNPVDFKTKYELAYKVLIESNSVTDGVYYYVNAKDGHIINTEKLVCTFDGGIKPPGNANGAADTKYSGYKSFVTDSYNGTFRLREIRNNVDIITLNAGHEANEHYIITNASDFFDNDNYWEAYEHGNDRVATDIHWAAEKVLDYWQQIHSRNNIDGLGMDIKSFVHVGNCYDNAYWLGFYENQTFNSLFCGDGCSKFGALGSLDLCGHEFGHGICEFTSDLNYSSGTESAALNEGFSDIWGASVEAWAAPNKQRWLIGEEITLVSPGYLRSMSNPPSGATQPSPDTYQDANWYNDADAHYRSGVLNKWYYLLSVGGSGTNGINNSYSVLGIGIQKAEQIAFRTEQLLNSSANYAMARTMSIQAVEELYGVNSCEEISVINAWYAVGIGAAFPTDDTKVQGNDALCAGDDSPYSIINIPYCPFVPTISWSITDGNGNPTTATISATTGTTTHVIIPGSLQSGSLVLTATLSNNSVFTKDIYIGVPYFGSYYNNGIENGPVAIYDPNNPTGNINNLCIGYPNSFIEAQPNGASSVTWSLAPGFSNYGFSVSQLTPTRANIKFIYNDATIGYAKGSITNSCGDYSNIYVFQSYNYNGGGDPCDLSGNRYFNVSPNPAKGNVKIKIGSKNPPIECLGKFSGYNESTGLTFDVVNIYNSKGKLMISRKSKKSKEMTFSVSNLISGIYIVEILSGEYREQQQLIIL